MWSIRSILCVLYVASVAFALPAAKTETEKNVLKQQPIILEAFELPTNDKPSELKPTDTKPVELIALDLKPIPEDAKPMESNKPSELGAIFPLTQTPGKPPRRQFFYDQRQDGKYNIRADLENFVILVVPSSGNSLLDLLKRSSQRHQHTKRNHAGKHHKKYASGSSTAGKTTDVPSKKTANRLDYLKPEGSEHETASAGEFIEGRTPYHVDISSAEILQPTPYGSNAVRALDAETAATTANVDNNANVDAVEPAAGTTDKGKNDENKSILAVPTITTNTHPRLSKSLTADSYGNSISNSNFVLLTRKSYRNDFTQPIDDSLNAKHYNNYFSHRPSVQIVNRSANDDDAIDLTDTNNSFNSLNVGNVDRLALAGGDTTKSVSDLTNPDWQLTLLGAEEQCGPDRRRDSYGICQFVPADYATT